MMSSIYSHDLLSLTLKPLYVYEIKQLSKFLETKPKVRTTDPFKKEWIYDSGGK